MDIEKVKEILRRHTADYTWVDEDAQAICQLDEQKVCPECRGYGSYWNVYQGENVKCEACHGEGRLYANTVNRIRKEGVTRECPECKGEGSVYPEGKPTYDDPARPSYLCDTCQGTGKQWKWEDDKATLQWDCPTCQGTGKAVDNE